MCAGVLSTARTLSLKNTSSCALTAREHEIVELIHQRLFNKQIATALGVELTTVKNHVHKVSEKLGRGPARQCGGGGARPRVEAGNAPRFYGSAPAIRPKT